LPWRRIGSSRAVAAGVGNFAERIARKLHQQAAGNHGQSIYEETAQTPYSNVMARRVAPNTWGEQNPTLLQMTAAQVPFDTYSTLQQPSDSNDTQSSRVTVRLGPNSSSNSSSNNNNNPFFST